jgi:hypothetical protein
MAVLYLQLVTETRNNRHIVQTFCDILQVRTFFKLHLKSQHASNVTYMIHFKLNFSQFIDTNIYGKEAFVFICMFAEEEVICKDKCIKM